MESYIYIIHANKKHRKISIKHLMILGFFLLISILVIIGISTNLYWTQLKITQKFEQRNQEEHYKSEKLQEALTSLEQLYQEEQKKFQDQEERVQELETLLEGKDSPPTEEMFDVESIRLFKKDLSPFYIEKFLKNNMNNILTIDFSLNNYEATPNSGYLRISLLREEEKSKNFEFHLDYVTYFSLKKHRRFYRTFSGIRENRYAVVRLTIWDVKHQKLLDQYYPITP